jgi:signal transduction histidine kinase
MKTDNALGYVSENAEQTSRRIANEFQTPLGVIISASELLQSYFDRLTPDRRHLALEDILCAARQMNSAMDQLMLAEAEKNSNSESGMPNPRGRIRKVHSSRKAIRSPV